MSSQTVIQPTRQWDYLYDATFTVSGQRDHQRQEMKAYTRGDRIRKNIKFQTMFSSLKHYPSYFVSLQKTDPIPPFIEKSWRRFPEASESAKAKIAPQVSGRNRYKYFRRPNIPALSSVAYQEIGESMPMTAQNLGPEENMANVVTVGALGQTTAVTAEPKKASDFSRTGPGLMKTQQTQTDYRESEAQTDPYSPEWVLSEGQDMNEAPEIVTLMSLTYGAGLPAGPIEIEMIERARARRKWEESLPPLNGSSPAALDKRRKMMAEAEKKQWQWREQNLERLHKARLELLSEALNDRNEMKEEQTEERLQTLKLAQENEARVALEKYRNEHIKAVRKLIKSSQKKMANVPDPSKHNHGKRDIVADYANCGSSSWAPLSRVGVFPDRKAEQNNIVNNENTTRYLSTLSGLMELESSLPRSVTEVSLQAPVKPVQADKRGGSSFVPRASRAQHELDQVYDMLKTQEMEKKMAKKKDIDPDELRLLKKIERPQPRPMTPTKTFDEELDTKEQAALVVQRLVRGKAIQKQWQEGAARRADLLAELRAVSALEKHEKEALAERQKALKLQQRNDVIKQEKARVVDSLINEMIGETIANKLDFVNKELIRLQEERRLHALSLLAERRRRMREAAESGLRQAEERRRREEDEIYKQVLKVHQDTVDQFLADVVCEANDSVADTQARKEVEQLADSMSKAAILADEAIRAAEEEGNMIKAQQLIGEICGELVHDFLIPETAKMEQREKEERKKTLRKETARSVVNNAADEQN